MTYRTIQPIRCEAIVAGIRKRGLEAVEMPPGDYEDAHPVRRIDFLHGDEIRVLRPADQPAGLYSGTYFYPQVERLREALAPAGDSSSPVLSPAGRGN